MSHCDCCPPTTKVAQTVYVDATFGSNQCGRPESFTHPYRTLNTAIRNTPAGWTVHMRPGEYYGSASLFDKNLFAELGVIIHVISSEFMDGVVSFEGYADLLIDEGSQAQLLFSRANSVAASRVAAKSLMDRGSTAVEAGVQFGLPLSAPGSVASACITFDTFLGFGLHYAYYRQYNARIYAFCAPRQNLQMISEPSVKIVWGKAKNFALNGTVLHSAGDNVKVTGASFKSAGVVVQLAGGHTTLLVDELAGINGERAAMGMHVLPNSGAQSRMVFQKVVAVLPFDIGSGGHDITVDNTGSLARPADIAFQFRDIDDVQIQAKYVYATTTGLMWDASTGGRLKYTGTQIGDEKLRSAIAVEVVRGLGSVSGAALIEPELLMDLDHVYADRHGFLFEGQSSSLLKVILGPKAITVGATAIRMNDSNASVRLTTNKLTQTGTQGPAIINQGGSLDVWIQDVNGWDIIANNDRLNAQLGTVTARQHFIVGSNIAGSPVTHVTADQVVAAGSFFFYPDAVGAVQPQYKLGIQSLRTGQDAFVLQGDPIDLNYNGGSVMLAEQARLLRDTTASSLTLSPDTVTGSSALPLLDFSSAAYAARSISGLYTNGGTGPTLATSGGAAAGFSFYSASLIAPNSYAFFLSDVTMVQFEAASAVITTSYPPAPDGQTVTTTPAGTVLLAF